MFGLDRRSRFEVGDRPRDLQNSVVGSGTEPLLRHGSLQEPLAVGVELTETAHVTG